MTGIVGAYGISWVTVLGCDPLPPNSLPYMSETWMSG